MDDASRRTILASFDNSTEEALAGAWVLVVGADNAAAARIRGRLASAGCAAVELASDVDEAADRAGVALPDVILALPGMGAPLRRRLDPMDLRSGPPVVGVDEIPALPQGTLGDQAVLERLASELERHRMRMRLRDLETALANQAAARQRDADRARLDGLRRLAMAAEYRDDNTWEHTQRVAAMAARLARRVGVDDRRVELIRLAAPLHDIGKIAIPDYILLKPDKLTDEEFAVVKTHASVGASILADSEDELIQTAEQITGAHHERWDGTGYPNRLAGDAIPIAGRVVAVADVFDILVHERPWKQEWKVEDAADEIRRSSGTQFDPAVVEAFEELGPATWQALATEI
jgi:putative nucleotidyltransferase with HDIG domain